MRYKKLYIFVEGQDDERFFENIFKPIFELKYDQIILWQYAEKTQEKIKNFIGSIKRMGADYIYATDINNEPCVTAKMGHTKKKIKNIDIENVVVVIKEIESWYLAGIDNALSSDIGIKSFIGANTDKASKEQFDKLIPPKSSRGIVMLKILNSFCIETAKGRNKSFAYFYNKFISRNSQMKNRLEEKDQGIV